MELYDILMKGQMTLQTPFTVTVPETDKLPMSNGSLVIPASSVRGKLRRSSFDGFAHIRPEWSLRDFRLNRMGGVMGKKKAEGEASYFDAERVNAQREANPHLSIFGAMAHGISGKLSCGDAVFDPVVVPEERYGVRSEDFEREPALIGLLDAPSRPRLLEQQRQGREASAKREEILEIRRQIRQLDDDDSEKVKLRQQIRDLEKDREQIDPNIKQILSHWVVPAHSNADHQMRLRNANEAELAFFLACLRRFGQEPRFGGLASKMYGYVTVAYTVTLLNSHNEVIGSLRSRDPNDWTTGIEIDSSHPAIETALAKWEEYLADNFSQFDFSDPEA